MAWASGQIGLYVEQYVPYIHAWSGNPCLDPAVNPAYYPSPIYSPDGFQVGGSGFKYIAVYDYRSTTPTGLLIAGSNDFVNWTYLNGDKAVSGIPGSARHTKLCPSGASGFMLYYWDSTQLYSPASIRRAMSYDLCTWFDDVPLASGGPEAWITGNGADYNYGTYGPIHVIYNPNASNSGSNPFDYSVTMYHDVTTGGTQDIALSYSSDGVIFHPCGIVIPRGHTSGVWDQNFTTAAAIVSGHNQWICFYGGGIAGANEGVGLARSKDGIAWIKDRNNPVIPKVPNTWLHGRSYAVGAVADFSGHFNGNGEPADAKLLVSGRSSTGNYAVGAFFYNNSYVTGTCSLAITGHDVVAGGLDDYGSGFDSISGSVPLFIEFNYPKCSGDMDLYVGSDATPVIWSGATVSGILDTINDGGEHFVLVDIAASGTNSWELSVSIDGQDFVSCGQPDTGNIGAVPSGGIAQVCMTPQSRLVPDGQYVDEVCLHSDGRVPTQIERERLFQLGDRLNLPLSMYNYSTIAGSGHVPLSIKGHNVASGALGMVTEWGSRGRATLYISSRVTKTGLIDLSIPYFSPASGLPGFEGVVYHHPCDNYHEVVGNQDWAHTAATFVATPDGSGLASSSVLYGSGVSYPTISGQTNLTWFMMVKNPGTIVTGRGYTFGISGACISFGSSLWQGTAISGLVTTLNDGRRHALMVNFRNFGDDQWLMRTSVDGSAWVDRGTQTSGLTPVLSSDEDPFLIIRDGTSDAIDDVIMWAGTSVDPSSMYATSGVYSAATMFIGGSGAATSDVFSIESLMQMSDVHPQLVGRFRTTPASPVTIELWECVSGVANPLSLTSNACYAIGDTGRWGWSTEYLPPKSRTVSQYTYRMTDGDGQIFQGHFTIRPQEISRTRVPRGADRQSAIRRLR